MQQKSRDDNSMQERPPEFFAAAYLVLLRDGKVLMLHRHSTGFMDERWGLPAGHIEKSEAVEDALRRETEEEIGIALLELRLAHVMHRVSTSERVYIDFFFTADSWSGELINVETDKHDKIEWFPLDRLPDDTIPYLRRALARIRQDQSFSEDITE